MELQQALQDAIQELPEERLHELLLYARFLAQVNDDEDWRGFARKQFSKAYGPDEPEYTEAGLKPHFNPLPHL